MSFSARDAGDVVSRRPPASVAAHGAPLRQRSRPVAAATGGITQPTWDVWLLFGRDARWPRAAAPEPAWWAHQLQGLPSERRLDPERFSGKARELQGR